ncbi:MAG: hypothetical protein R2737_08625 [Candidatus Nanopelagicales bacterium]
MGDDGVAPRSGGSLGADVALLLEVAERIGTRVADGEHRQLDGAAHAGLAAELVRATGLGEAAAAELLRAAYLTGDLRSAGFFSVRGFVADGLGVSRGQAGRISGLGVGLERHPRLRDGVLAGRICADAARAAAQGIASAVADLRGPEREDARTKGEAIMLPVCEAGTVADVERVAAALVFHLDPESAARRALEALERRHVRVGRVGATAVVTMVLDALTAAQLVELLEARVDRWFRTGSLPEDLLPTGDEEEDERRRTVARPRLLADAFAEILTELVGSQSAGTRNGAPVSASVLVSADHHRDGAPGQLLLPGREPVTVAAETVERVLCDAEVTEVHVDGLVPDRSSLGQIARSDRRTRDAAAGVDPHDLTGQCSHVHCIARRYRTATRDQRTALAVRDRHCRFPGCRVGAERCEAHHVREWERGGATCLSNLVLVCSRHHHLLHEGRWRILADADLDPGHPDRWRFTPPDHGYVGVDGATVAERLRRGHPPEPQGGPPPRSVAA